MNTHRTSLFGPLPRTTAPTTTRNNPPRSTAAHSTLDASEASTTARPAEEVAIAAAAHAAAVASGTTYVPSPKYVWFITSDDSDKDDDNNIAAVVNRPCHHPEYRTRGREVPLVGRLTESDRRSARSSTTAMRICKHHMYPAPDRKYMCAPRHVTYWMKCTIDNIVAQAHVVQKYNQIFAEAPRTEVKDGLVGYGLFLLDDVPLGYVIIEYIGNRVRPSDVRLFLNALDAYGESSDTLITMPTEKAIIDPRACGGDARFVNHSCSPNCELHQVAVGDGRFVAALSSLVDLMAGRSVL